MIWFCNFEFANIYGEILGVSVMMRSEVGLCTTNYVLRVWPDVKLKLFSPLLIIKKKSNMYAFTSTLTSLCCRCWHRVTGISSPMCSRAPLKHMMKECVNGALPSTPLLLAAAVASPSTRSTRKRSAGGWYPLLSHLVLPPSTQWLVQSASSLM